VADDARVNANGYHKLSGFERLEFSQNTAKQTVTIAAADVDQLAEKNLVGDPNRAANTSNLYAELGSNDHLVATGFSNNTAPTRGYWKDVNGVVYDRKYSLTGSAGSAIGAGDTANLFVRGGDDAPELGNTSTAGSYSTSGGSTTLSLGFNETMVVNALTAGDFSITHSGGAVTATSASMTASGLTVGYNGGALSGVLRLQCSGTQLVDNQGDQLRFKDISLGTSSADIINGAGRGTNQALIGNAGNDVITGGIGDDLLMGGFGNDFLSGGLGADIFRFINAETGTDTITDFNLSQGDKIDLRGLLDGSGMTTDSMGLFLRLVDGVGEKTLKVDLIGTGNFTNSDMTIIMNNPVGINVDLATLIDQRVLRV
jgi:Ca2+-binding RTX toxin-like protein